VWLLLPVRLIDFPPIMAMSASLSKTKFDSEEPERRTRAVRR
jgi:hypothetical protein